MVLRGQGPLVRDEQYNKAQIVIVQLRGAYSSEYREYYFIRGMVEDRPARDRSCPLFTVCWYWINLPERGPSKQCPSTQTWPASAFSSLRHKLLLEPDLDAYTREETEMLLETIYFSQLGLDL